MATLAVCQLFHPRIHGGDDSTEANGHFLTLHSYDREHDDSPYAFLDYWTSPGTNEEQEAELRAVRMMKDMLGSEEDSVSNFREVNRIPYVDIVETVELGSGHTVAIKKTLWLSIFQRMLKKRYSKQNQRKRARRS